MSQFKHYDGIMDLMDHLKSFKALVLLQRVTSAVMSPTLQPPSGKPLSFGAQAFKHV